MAHVGMWEQYAALPIKLSVPPKDIEELRAYRQHLYAKQIVMADRHNESEFEKNRIVFWLNYLADLEDAMLAKGGMGVARP
jgi:hypothetical protein